MQFLKHPHVILTYRLPAVSNMCDNYMRAATRISDEALIWILDIKGGKKQML